MKLLQLNDDQSITPVDIDELIAGKVSEKLEAIGIFGDTDLGNLKIAPRNSFLIDGRGGCSISVNGQFIISAPDLVINGNTSQFNAYNLVIAHPQGGKQVFTGGEWTSQQ